jgi:predicted DNA-binding protein (MmcQ/YjbR family)
MARFNFLEKMIKENKYKVGVEIGVQQGTTFKHLISKCEGLELYGVDIWSTKNVRWDGSTSEDLEKDKTSVNYGYYLDLQNWITFQAGAKDRAHLIRKLSLDAAKDFQDESLDFIFIDASHQYPAVLDDMKAWIPKVRKGGLVSGDDYGDKFPGVAKSVAEYGHPFGLNGPVWWWIKD